MTPEQAFQSHIAENPYPGRGLVVGRDASGEWTIVYWIMGRSEGSRNRRFVATGGSLRTEPVDVDKLGDPSLIIYEAMLELPGVQLVSNGDQTRSVFDTLQNGGRFTDAMREREREPDAPNYTPRIGAVLDFRRGSPSLTMSLLLGNEQDPTQTDYCFFHPAPPRPGTGRALTTYAGDGNPVPSFRRLPMTLPLPGDTQSILDHYWGHLSEENRVALAVKRVTAAGELGELLVRNRFA